ncbi:uncharacterized protein LOC126712626 [Quercus robur]|uniref:uncharacterized protein LOC126712626 n=1 Tax=Quercus robur TaxID=38942 RepID=UPI00216348F9|nr:uncharacterized protein LOC126712626 [Quercus robur]
MESVRFGSYEEAARIISELLALYEKEEKMWQQRSLVTEEMKVELARPYTSDEVDAAIKEMAPLKAPGPDGRKGFMALKLDMSKAYDRVEWVFLEKILLKMGSILEECLKIQSLLDIYEVASGQMINKEKTMLFFSENTDTQTQDAIKVALNVPAIQHYEKYLGLPSFIGREKKAYFTKVKERIWARMQGWKEKLLSQAGKEVTIKVVIQSIPTYSMSVFKLPINLCKDIEAMIRKFWWGQGDSKKIHWVKWSSLCSSKSIVGMGFRDIQKFNNALLVKQVWWLIHQKDTLLYKVFSAKYFPHGSIMDASVPQKCSYAWRSILQAREVIEKCAIWRVGSGHGIDVWKHRWLPNPTYNKIVSPRRESSVSRVSELFYPNIRIWDPGKLEENFYPWEAEMKRYRSFQDLLEAVMLKSSQFRVALFCTTAWSLWQRRNRLREKQPSWNLHELGSQAKAYVVDFLNANYQPSQVSSWHAQVSWSPPTESVYKGNFDAAFFDTSGCAGVGVVFHDFQGQVITALSQKIPLV